MKTNRTSVIALSFILVLAFNLCIAQGSFSSFKASYKPQNQLFSPDNDIVVAADKLDINACAATLEKYILTNDLRSFALIIISIDRTKAGKVIDAMSPETAIKGLQFLAGKWILEMAYYVSEPTYNSLASKLEVIKNYQSISLK